MQVFKRKSISPRGENTSVVACESYEHPGEGWELAGPEALEGLERLHTINGARYYGYL